MIIGNCKDYESLKYNCRSYTDFKKYIENNESLKRLFGINNINYITEEIETNLLDTFERYIKNGCYYKEEDEIYEEGNDLIKDIYVKKKNMIGMKTKKGVIITKLLVDGRKSDINETMIYLGIDESGKEVIVKLIDSSSGDKSSILDSVEKMNVLKSKGIDIYDYYIDYFEGYDGDFEELLVMEKLMKSSDIINENKGLAFLMLSQIIPTIFLYRHFMTHCDIKPDNIMYKKENNKFYLVDYDDICDKKYLHGYSRSTFTPLFTSQTPNFFPVLVTIKQDLIELIYSVHSIFYNNISDNYIGTKNDNKFNPRFYFDILLRIIYNIDEFNIKNDDMNLLLTCNNILFEIYNSEIENKTEIIDKINKIYKILMVEHNSSVILQSL